jgi:branched-chain amino acid aminotransferase
VDYTAESLNAAAQYEPTDGVYTVTNTHHTYQVLKLSAHLDRLGNSAQYVGIPLQLERSKLRLALRQMISESGFDNVRFRVTVPRQQPDHYIISMERFQPQPPEVYANGVHCATEPNSARRNPSSKTTGWMHDRQHIRNRLTEDIYEALLLNEKGDILEGSGSNFYAIVAGELYTVGDGALPGIAQQVVFAVAPAILPVHKRAVNVRDLSRVDEAFITSSSRGIVPVVKIDGQTIGQGQPGSLTNKLREVYNAWVEDNLEEL